MARDVLCYYFTCLSYDELPNPWLMNIYIYPCYFHAYREKKQQSYSFCMQIFKGLSEFLETVHCEEGLFWSWSA